MQKILYINHLNLFPSNVCYYFLRILLIQTYAIEDCDLYIDGSVVPSYLTIPTGMSVTSNGSYITITSSTSGEKVVWLPYTVTTDEDYVFETEIAKAGTSQSIALYYDDGYGYHESSSYNARFNGVTNRSVSKSVASGDKFIFKHENNTLTAYINNQYINSKTGSIINHRFGYYTNNGRVQHLKNIKIKRL